MIKTESINTWREHSNHFYDILYQNVLQWPVSSVQWGPLLHNNGQISRQRVYFSCKTDGLYSYQQNLWQHTPNYLIMANVELPNEDNYFIPGLKSLFDYDNAKKHPSLKIKQVISHPGQITVIRTCPNHKKILASKNDHNSVFIWTNDKYKSINHSFCTIPDITLQTTKSNKPNYALKFSPSLPKIITASNNKLELFDIDSSSNKRQLGSVLLSNIIKPLTTLQGLDKTIQDITFINNEICISGGQDGQIGIWDLRIGFLNNKIINIHQNDINTIAYIEHYIISGGQQGKINIIDQRTYKIVEQFQSKSSIHSIQFNINNSYFAIGTDKLSIYNFNNILHNHQLKSIFTHHGLKGNINQFDWNVQSSMTIISTFQDIENQLGAQGGLIHIYKPSDIYFKSKQQSINNLKQAYYKITTQQQDKIKQYLYQFQNK